MNKEFADADNIVENEGNLKAYLQFLFSLFKINDVESIPSIIESCHGNKQQLYDKLVTMILSSIQQSCYVVDESDDSLEQNSSSSFPNCGCYRFSNTNEQLSNNDNLRKEYQPKANIFKLHEYLDNLSTKQNCNDCSEEIKEQNVHNNTNQCCSSIPLENQQVTNNNNNNKIPSITKCSLPLIDSEVLTIFNRINPEDTRRKSSASKESDETEDKDVLSIKTHTSYMDDTLETFGYSLTSYIRNTYNVFSTTSFVIDPSESKIFRLWFRNLEISKQGRVEIKTFLILLLHRLLIRMEEGDEHHQWQPDDTVTNCSICNTSFSIIKRKHHCRICGRIFCSKCSKHKLVCSFSGKPERVCDICFVLYLRMPHISSM